MTNGLAAVAAAYHVGVPIDLACEALSYFDGVQRRMECLANIKNIKVYDDFAQHPTAIQTTLEGLRANVGEENIIAIIEPRSNTMRMSIHPMSQLANCCSAADFVCWYQPDGIQWNLEQVINMSSVPAVSCRSHDSLIAKAVEQARIPSHIVIMSNGSFEGVHQRIIKTLQEKYGD